MPTVRGATCPPALLLCGGCWRALRCLFRRAAATLARPAPPPVLTLFDWLRYRFARINRKTGFSLAYYPRTLFNWLRYRFARIKRKNTRVTPANSRKANSTIQRCAGVLGSLAPPTTTAPALAHLRLKGIPKAVLLP